MLCALRYNVDLANVDLAGLAFEPFRSTSKSKSLRTKSESKRKSQPKPDRLKSKSGIDYYKSGKN